ncbi:MAG: alpha-2-macroglobulin family protein [Candidatus Promineifilaceae bacterium]
MRWLRSIFGRPWMIAVLVVVCLGGAALAAFAGWSLLRNRGGGGSSTPIVINNGGGGGVSGVSAGSFGVDSNGRLVFSLSKGQEGSDTYELLPVAVGTPLSPEEIQQILDRLPPATAAPGDQVEFNLPDEILPPPQPGETVNQPFGEIPDVPTPEVPSGPLEVLRFAPEGEIPLAPFLSVTFNQPMVPLATLEELSTADVPVRISPEIPGVWRWLGTKTLTFEYAGVGGGGDRFPMATEYTAEIPAGTESAVGTTLAESVTWRFSTPPPQMTDYYPAGGPQVLDPVFFVAFDQLIDPEAVLASISVTADGENVALQLATAEDIASDERVQGLTENTAEGRWLAFRATESLPSDADIVVTIAPGTPSAEGPLATEEEQSFSFHTYAALAIEDHACSWYNDDCPPLTPFWIGFNNPIDPDAFDPGMIEIEPELVGARVQVQGSRLEIQGLTKGRTTYRVTVDGSIQDMFGQQLGDSETLSFQVTSAPSALSGPDQYLVTLDPSAKTPVFTVYTINYSRLHVRVYQVEPEDWRTYLTYRDNYWRQDNPPTPPGDLVMDETIGVENVTDELTEVPINLSEALDGDTGHLVVIVEPPSGILDNNQDRNAVQSWVQVTKIGLDAFVDNSQLIAWATNLEDGTPLSDVEVALEPGNGTATTDSEGLARIMLGSNGNYLVAHQGEDTAILPANPYYWDDNAWAARPSEDELRWFVFDDRQMYRPGEEVHVKGWLRIVGGGLTGDVGLPGTGLEQIRYSVTGPQGNKLADGRATVNALGGFDLSFTVPENSNLGYANVMLHAVGNVNVSYNLDYYHGFQIQEFRRPEFEVTARTETSGPYFVGDQATVAASANYFAGGALPNAETQWYVCSQPGSYSPPNWPEFTFGTWTPWWYFGDYFYEDSFYSGPYSGGSEDTCQNFSGTTDAAGENYLQINIESADTPKPFSLQAEATVFDVNRQAWSASTSLLVHPSSLYVGLRGDRTFVEQGEPMEIQAIVTDLDGNAVSGRPVTVQAARLEWNYRDGSWGQEEVDTQSCDVTSTTEPVSCIFDTAVGGEYQIKAMVTDEQGRLNQSTLTRWVSGGERPPTRNVDQEQLTLIPDKELYAPGDTAEILVQSPFSPAEGLLTVSRSGILYTERFQITEDSYVVRIPIEEAHLPNLQVQIDLTGSAPRTDDAGEPIQGLPNRPAFATGNLTLNISTQSRSLSVDVVPQTASLEPGAETAVDMMITDANGSPVSDAEVALFVVDESVLALSGYSLQDPLDVFYSLRDGYIQSVYGRNSIILANPESLANGIETSVDDSVEVTRVVTENVQEGELAAGAAPAAQATNTAELPMEAMAEESALDSDATLGADNAAGQANTPITVRTDFNPLAVFAPAVHTDSDGRAVVSLTLPDNLTRYRVMAVAVSDGKQFGTGESNLTARLPLMVRPSAPRFLNFGDRFELPIVLQNQTDEDMSVDVVVQATNIQWIGEQGGGQRVTVPANDRIEVRFPATTDSVGTARFQIAAVSGPYADAATVELPVYTPATTEAFATYGILDGVGGQTVAIAQPIVSPTGVFPQFGGLEIQTSSTALQGLTDAVLYLTSYPYECSEQLASRILAIAALRDVLTAFEADGLPTPAEMESAVTRDIDRLQGMQNNDGGWPVWQRGDDSNPFYTIHVVHALARAEQKNFSVPDAMMQNGLAYLRNIESYYPDWYSQTTRQTLSAYAIYVRFLAGDSDAAKASRLLDEAGLDSMSLEALAWLWPVLDSGSQYGSQVTAIGDLFNNRVVETAAAANFTTSYGDQEYLLLHSNRRTDGVILDSLISVEPDSDLIPKVVNGLLANRTHGRWGNTQENVFILLALDHYFNTFENVTPDFAARLWLGETYVGEHDYKGRTTVRNETFVPMQYLTETAETQNLIISEEGQGRLYYRLGLQYAPDDLELDALDMGFAVQRTYEAVDDPDDVYQDENGVWHFRAGARVRVKIEMATSNRRYNVALVDPLPAGLEIINPALAVSGSVPQDPTSSNNHYGWWWWGTWYEHQNMRDERAEAFTTLLWDGVYTYSYVTRATTPGIFVVPPTKAEEMYSPEVFGRSSSDTVIVE